MFLSWNRVKRWEFVLPTKTITIKRVMMMSLTSETKSVCSTLIVKYKHEHWESEERAPFHSSVQDVNFLQFLYFQSLIMRHIQSDNTLRHLFFLWLFYHENFGRCESHSANRHMRQQQTLLNRSRKRTSFFITVKCHIWNEWEFLRAKESCLPRQNNKRNISKSS